MWKGRQGHGASWVLHTEPVTRQIITHWREEERDRPDAQAVYKM
jgi:hypothetical protein